MTFMDWFWCTVIILLILRTPIQATGGIVAGLITAIAKTLHGGWSEK